MIKKWRTGLRQGLKVVEGTKVLSAASYEFLDSLDVRHYSEADPLLKQMMDFRMVSKIYG